MNEQNAFSSPTESSYGYTNPSSGGQFNGAPMPKKRSSLLPLLVMFFGLFVIGLTTTVAYAYGQISFGDKETQEKVSDFVQSLPFTTKTPRFVLKSSVAAHKKVTRFRIDASLATSIQSLATSLGTSNLDIRISGPIDYTDPRKPIMDLNAKFTKDFDADLKTKDYMTYFKINKVPSMASMYMAMFGFRDDILQKFLNKWFYYDTTPLDTEARYSLDKNNTTNESATNKLIKDYFTALDDPIISKHITMESVKLNEADMHHISFTPPDEILDLFWDKYTKQYASDTDDTSSYVRKPEKISSYINNFKYEGWVDKKTYYLHKTSIYFVIKPTDSSAYSLYGGGALSQPIPISFVVSLSDYGKQIPIEIPADAVKFDEYMKEIFESESTQGGGLFGDAARRSNDVKRKSDLASLETSLQIYYADEATMPKAIKAIDQEIGSSGADLCKELLSNENISSLPVDPSVGSSPVTDCSKPYTTGYTIKKSGTKIVISAPYAEYDQALTRTVSF